jgi:hypothetical protein
LNPQLAARLARANGAPKALLLGQLLLLLAVPALAERPHHAVYQGRLTNAAGAPQQGQIVLGLSIFDTEGPGGTALYVEEHPGVLLQSDGSFSVHLGGGVPLSGGFGPETFLSGRRFLEVQVDGQAMSPRQPIGAVPSALVAERLATPALRFEVCPSGATIADHQTGLLWEKKTHPTGKQSVEFHEGHSCSSLPQPEICAQDVHDVRNRYSWGVGSPLAPAEAFTDFLARLNGTFDPIVERGCFEGRCDWRLPQISELATIMVGPEAAPGQAEVCPQRPCVDPQFLQAEGGGGGSVANSFYWSSSQDPFFPSEAWFAGFDVGDVGLDPAAFDSFLRAVRTGSCR